MVEGGFVIVRRGDRLHLEIHGLVAGGLEGPAQAFHGVEIVVFGFRAHVAYRATDQGVTDGKAELLFRLLAEVGEDTGDQFFERAPLAKDVGRGEGPAGEIAFERLNQAAFGFGGEILLDGGRPGPGFDGGAAALFVMFEIEQGAVGLGGAAGKREADEVDIRAAFREGDGAVGGSKIDSDGGVLAGRHFPHDATGGDVRDYFRPCESLRLRSSFRQFPGARRVRR